MRPPLIRPSLSNILDLIALPLEDSINDHSSHYCHLLVLKWSKIHSSIHHCCVLSLLDFYLVWKWCKSHSSILVACLRPWLCFTTRSSKPLHCSSTSCASMSAYLSCAIYAPYCCSHLSCKFYLRKMTNLPSTRLRVRPANSVVMYWAAYCVLLESLEDCWIINLDGFFNHPPLLCRPGGCMDCFVRFSSQTNTFMLFIQVFYRRGGEAPFEDYV